VAGILELGGEVLDFKLDLLEMTVLFGQIRKFLQG
jgi:hypothetical protein